MTRFHLQLEPVLHITQEQFYQVCQQNPEIKLELTTSGEMILMSPTGGETGRANLNIAAQLWNWNEKNQLGEAFDSSTGFSLPNGAERSPDASWIKKSRWRSLTKAQKEKFIPLCPDFVIELLSPTDNLTTTRAKMQEYIDNGCRLGWLINRQKKQVEIYQPNQPVEILNQPQTLSGKEILPDFILNLAKIWS